MNTYKMDFASKTLTLTKAFSDACADPTSAEYKILTHFQRDFPDLKIVRKTHKTPTKYKNSNGEITHCNQFKNLTYKNIERFICALPNSEELLKVYHFLRYDAGFLQTNAYKIVRKWFAEQFPKYHSNPLFYISNEVKVVDISRIIESEQKGA